MKNNEDEVRAAAKAYLKTYFLKQVQNHVAGAGPTEEDWNRIPPDLLEQWVDMLCTFKPGAPAGALDKIIAESKKTSHSDASFGFAVKQILKQ